MTLAAGARLGPYEILALIGADEMGTRAAAAKLSSESAVRVLSAKGMLEECSRFVPRAPIDAGGWTGVDLRGTV